MTLYGNSIIAGAQVAGTGRFRAVDPRDGAELEPAYGFCSAADLDCAVEAAAESYDHYRATTPEDRAAFLERIADQLEARGDELVARAGAETALPEARLRGELARTTNQLRLFASEVRLGTWQGVRVDHPTDAGGPDVRQRKVPLGPVVVFGASNFPFAFSTAGGDTASALAAGCPVVVKAHNAHPGAAELAGQAITEAVSGSGLPAGVFSLVFGDGAEPGQHLVAHPQVAAVAFTGSRAGGLALLHTAQARPVPIPVYAEMSATNPVILLPGALAGDVDGLAAGYVSSLTLGAGQFCTNPGVLYLPGEDPGFTDRVATAIADHDGAVMLTGGIASAYRAGVERLGERGVAALATGRPGPGESAPAATVVTTTAAAVREDPVLAEEVFGAAGVIASYDDLDDVIAGLGGMEGQLTVTVWASEADHGAVRRLLPVLERLAGRVIFNGWPTGVEVNHAMVHGGPYPATSDARTTSVGTLAIERFLRPVAYQGFPDDLLPEPVREANPWSLPRRVDGTPTLG